MTISSDIVIFFSVTKNAYCHFFFFCYTCVCVCVNVHACACVGDADFRVSNLKRAHSKTRPKLASE